jgi:hypothetical protein
MKSKLLQKISYSQTHQSDEVLDDQQENTEDPSKSWKGHVTPPNPVNPAADAQARFVNTAHSPGPVPLTRMTRIS